MTGGCKSPSKDYAKQLQESLAREFDSSTVALKMESVEEHGAKSACKVVLENTGEELHAMSPNATFPSETDQLMLVSKIGTYLSKQRSKK